MDSDGKHLECLTTTDTRPFFDFGVWFARRKK
jgi:hypothetical protein